MYIALYFIIGFILACIVSYHLGKQKEDVDIVFLASISMFLIWPIALSWSIFYMFYLKGNKNEQ